MTLFKRHSRNMISKLNSALLDPDLEKLLLLDSEKAHYEVRIAEELSELEVIAKNIQNKLGERSFTGFSQEILQRELVSNNTQIRNIFSAHKSALWVKRSLTPEQVIDREILEKSKMKKWVSFTYKKMEIDHVTASAGLHIIAKVMGMSYKDVLKGDKAICVLRRYSRRGTLKFYEEFGYTRKC